ncbi:hypothetical protein M422DRAFT_177959, partial [Sphaerobolus stellatus SS14]
LNVLHRASGRICLVLLWVHALGRYSNGLSGRNDFTHGWMLAGGIGLISLTLAFVCSLRPIRQSAFDFFFYSHILLILSIILIFERVLTSEFSYNIYIWPGLVAWGFDRTVRFLRVFWVNRIWQGKNRVQATMELLGSDTIRLSCYKKMAWKAGQHMYVSVPGISAAPFEAHPFTIANIPNLDETGTKKVVFLIKARNGFTKRLKDFVDVRGISSVSAFVDGPYGCPPDLSHAETVVLIAGGSGISVTLSLLADLVQSARIDKAVVKRILWVWTVQDISHLRWIPSALHDACANLPPHVFVDLQVFVSSTRGGGTLVQNEPGFNQSFDSPANTSSTGHEKISEKQFYRYTWRYGRPKVPDMLADLVAVSTGRMSVVVAGPPGLTQAVRGVLRGDLASTSSVLRGGPLIELHTESFGTVRG